MGDELFKPPVEEPTRKPKLQAHQVCGVCGKELDQPQWAKRGWPGLCDACSKEHAPRV